MGAQGASNARGASSIGFEAKPPWRSMRAVGDISIGSLDIKGGMRCHSGVDLVDVGAEWVSKASNPGQRNR